jgi:acetyltransferase-like isoleucine patch superfamily enzyme
VIGANSVVNRDIEPGTIAAGAPAREIRKIQFHAATAKFSER